MAERRKDYRVKVRAQISIKLVGSVPEEEHCARGHFMNEDLMAFASAYESLSDRSVEAMTRLRNSDSELSDLLSLLDQKLNLIEQRFHVTDAEAKAKPRTICLSGSGAAFRSAKSYEEESYLAIKLTLFPGHSIIYSFAKITRCSPMDKGGYEVAVNFVNLSIKESSLLRRHIMQVERELLRRDAKVAAE